MSTPTGCHTGGAKVPSWVPDAAKHYLFHTEKGRSIRALARDAGCHASTILRQVRRFENRRDDPLVDAALRDLGATHFSAQTNTKSKERLIMTAPIRHSDLKPQEQSNLKTEACRILRRLCESGAVLVVATDMEKAVVVRELAGGKTTRTGVVEREIAQAMALKDWIACSKSGRVTQYEITSAGRAALKRMLADDPNHPGDSYGDQHRVWGEKTLMEEGSTRARRYRYNLAESPLAAVARRKDKDGNPFLSDDLVAVGERLREDFELAQMGPRVAQNWDKFLTGGDRGSYAGDSGIGNGPNAARDRVSGALRELGPGLGDVVLRCCCFLEGMETAEKRMGWSARSGKIVLRIALQRLKQHYDGTHGKYGAMIG